MSNPNNAEAKNSQPGGEEVVRALAALLGPGLMRQVVGDGESSHSVEISIDVATSGPDVDIEISGLKPLHVDREAALRAIGEAEQSPPAAPPQS